MDMDEEVIEYKKYLKASQVEHVKEMLEGIQSRDVTMDSIVDLIDHYVVINNTADPRYTAFLNLYRAASIASPYADDKQFNLLAPFSTLTGSISFCCFLILVDVFTESDVQGFGPTFPPTGKRGSTPQA